MTVTGTDAAGAAATKTYAIQINGPLGLGGSLPTGEINRPYSFTLRPERRHRRRTRSRSRAARLPPGLTLSASGTISGTPTSTGSFSVTIRVRDATNATTTKNYTLQVVAAPVITTTSLQPWTINRDYPGTQIQATGGVGSNTFAVTVGLPPPGMAVSSAGLVTGTPNTTGTYAFTVTRHRRSRRPGHAELHDHDQRATVDHDELTAAERRDNRRLFNDDGRVRRNDTVLHVDGQRRTGRSDTLVGRRPVGHSHRKRDVRCSISPLPTRPARAPPCRSHSRSRRYPATALRRCRTVKCRSCIRTRP